jgi:hypothetical protein
MKDAAGDEELHNQRQSNFLARFRSRCAWYFDAKEDETPPQDQA